MLFYLVFISSVSLSLATSQPNIILIVADDLGWNDVGFHGSNQIPTPNIDALAFSGVILNNYYVLPLCTPSRAALLTGKHPIHTGMQHHVIVANEPWGLGLDERLLPEYLKHEGYATHAVGKWHLGFYRQEYTPTFRGFDSHFGYWASHQDYFDHTLLDDYWGLDLREGLNLTRRRTGQYTTSLLTDEAVSVIRGHDAARPLFLYLAHLAVHSANPYRPLQAPSDVIESLGHIQDPDRRVFAAMVTMLDRSVGAVTSALAARGMLENSVIVFTTDNGGAAGGYDNSAGSNWPLRGVKDTMWEGGVRGAALVWSPLLRNTPRVSSQLAHVQDWLPTLVHAANGSSLETAGLDGRDIWEALSDPREKTYDELLITIDDVKGYSALRSGKWKLLQGTTNNGDFDRVIGPEGREGSYALEAVQTSEVARALASTSSPLPSSGDIKKLRREATLTCRKENPRLVCRPSEGEVCLFDLENDPCEGHNRAATHPAVLAALLARLDAHNATAVTPRNQPFDPASNPKYWDRAWTNWGDFPRPHGLGRSC